jgi:hypothetical protein
VTKNAALVGHAVVGWAVCGGTIAVGRQILSMATTLLVHAIVAPLVFALLSMHFFRRYPAASPLRTSLGFVGIVVALDAFVVAPLIERSYAMFTSPLGTWIPSPPYGCQASLSERPGNKGKRGINGKRDTHDRLT